MNYDQFNIDSNNRFKRLVRYLTDYIYTVKIYKGKVVETVHGPGCLSVTGYSSSDYYNDPELWYRMVYEDDKKKVIEQAQKALSGKEVEPIEHRIIHRDGSVKWVRNSIVLTKDYAGNMLYYDGLITDITERKRAEELAEEKQQQLVHADKMASLGVLVSGVAHEINNPNNFILLNGQFNKKILNELFDLIEDNIDTGILELSGLEYEDAKRKILQSVDGILDGSRRIQKIVKSLTSYSRQDGGELNHKVELDCVIKNAKTIVGNMLRKSTNNFIEILPQEMPVIKGNKQQLEQVLINLITNACQSLKNKDDKIILECGYTPDKKKIIISVEDEGCGIEPENLKKIFDPFFTTKRNTGGTGLGLSISYNIIKSHGGKLNAYNRNPNGARFEVILPVYEEKSEVEDE